jgi:hypothetical protein
MAAERGSITADTTLRLAVAAGGRCEYCNTYLLEDDFSGYSVNLGERAHIVGATDATRSPRGDADLPLAERQDADNLMLLCRPHHRVIDRLIAEHTVEGLRRMKREHEDRIRLLTGFKDDVATVVVRVTGGIRGAPVEVPRETVLAAVRRDGRFPRYRLALAGEDVEVDLRGVPDEGDPSYWTTGARIIEQAAARIREAQQPIGHLSVFALTRIPLLVALGYHLDDKIPTSIYQRRRDGTGDQGWGFDPDAAPVAFRAERIAGPGHGPRVALAVSLTAGIGSEVAVLAGDAAVYEIVPDRRVPSRDVLSARASLDAFAATYRRFLATVEQDHPDCTQIDIFVAAPAAAAVQLGRGVMRDAQPALVVHDRNAGGRFQPALALGVEMAQPARSSR